MRTMNLVCAVGRWLGVAGVLWTLGVGEAGASDACYFSLDLDMDGDFAWYCIQLNDPNECDSSEFTAPFDTADDTDDTWLSVLISKDPEACGNKNYNEFPDPEDEKAPKPPILAATEDLSSYLDLDRVSTVAPTTESDDCDDFEETINTNATESCDEIDNDCDDLIDNDDTDITGLYDSSDANWRNEAKATIVGADLYYLDSDGDGCISSTPAGIFCDDGEESHGLTTSSTDCPYLKDDVTDNDSTADCDDGKKWLPTLLTCYFDGDDDGYGTPGEKPIVDCQCNPTYSYADNMQDCNDSDFDINPGETEICDGINNGCTECVLDTSTTPETWTCGIPGNETDDDGDGYVECENWDGAKTLDGKDCDDGDGSIYPKERDGLCNGKDDSCSDCEVDMDDTTWTCVVPEDESDDDGDGYVECNEWVGDSSIQGNDCNDDPELDGIHDNPAAPESCDGRDNNCDDNIDEPYFDGTNWTWPIGAEDRWVDSDKDGYGQRETVQSTSTAGAHESPPYLQVCDSWLRDGDGLEYIDIHFGSPCKCDDGDTAAEDTAAEDTAAEDTAAEDTAVEDTAAEDTAAEDTAIDCEAVCTAHDALKSLFGNGVEPIYVSEFDNDCDDTDNFIYPDPSRPEVMDGKDTNCTDSISVAELDCDHDGYMVGDPGASITYDFKCIENNYLDLVCVSPRNGGLIPVVGRCNRLTLQIDGADTPVNVYQWEISTQDSAHSQLFDSTLFRLHDVPTNGGDCDDTCPSRNPGRDEECDGLDNNCNGNDAIAYFQDANGDGDPDAFNGGLPGTISVNESDIDDDGAIACSGEGSVQGEQNIVASTTCDEIAEQGDPLGMCYRSSASPEEVDTVCDGIRSGRRGTTLSGERDDDNDLHNECGVTTLDASAEQSAESVFLLAYFEDDLAVPLLLPRGIAGGDGVLTSDSGLQQSLLRLLDRAGLSSNAQKLVEEGASPSKALDTYVQQDPLLELCIRAEVCGQEGTRKAPLPGYCENLSGQCAVLELTLSNDAPAYDSDPKLLGGAEATTDTAGIPLWETHPRTVWYQGRILESRRRVVEWDCFLTYGTLGCGALTADNGTAGAIDRLQKVGVKFRAQGGERQLPDIDLELLAEDWWKEVGRFGILVSTDNEMLLGCWSNPTTNPNLSNSDLSDPSIVSHVVGGDCSDSPEAHRDALEGPDDLMGVFLGEQASCQTCTDGLDNNCDGLTDCEDPACDACFVGQGVGGCGGGDSDSPCRAGAGSCSATRGPRSAWELLGLIGLALCALALPLWRRES